MLGQWCCVGGCVGLQCWFVGYRYRGGINFEGIVGGRGWSSFVEVRWEGGYVVLQFVLCMCFKGCVSNLLDCFKKQIVFLCLVLLMRIFQREGVELFWFYFLCGDGVCQLIFGFGFGVGMVCGCGVVVLVRCVVGWVVVLGCVVVVVGVRRENGWQLGCQIGWGWWEDRQVCWVKGFVGWFQ